MLVNIVRGRGKLTSVLKGLVSLLMLTYMSDCLFVCLVSACLSGSSECFALKIDLDSLPINSSMKFLYYIKLTSF